MTAAHNFGAWARSNEKLRKWICQSTAFQLNGKFCKQIGGVAIKPSVATLLADVIINYVVDQALEKSNVQNKPIVFWRYVDYIYLLPSTTWVRWTFFLKPSKVYSKICLVTLVEWLS